MGKLERRLEELRRLRDAGTISEEEHAAARQRAVEEETARPPGPFRFGFRFVLGGIAAMLIVFIVLAFAFGAFFRAGGESCSSNGTPVLCTTQATPIVVIQ